MTTKPGWYRDPNMPNTARYWDGRKWTNHIKEIKAEVKAGDAPSPAPAAPAKPTEQPAIAFPWKQTTVGGKKVLAQGKYVDAAAKSAALGAAASAGMIVPGVGGVKDKKPGDDAGGNAYLDLLDAEAEPNYARARRGRTADQFFKVLTGSLASLAVGAVIGIGIGMMSVPNVQQPKFVEQMVVQPGTAKEKPADEAEEPTDPTAVPSVAG